MTFDLMFSKYTTYAETNTKEGIDWVFKKGGKYFVVEYKYNTSQLNGSTADGIQMSDDWVNSRLADAVGSSTLAKSIRASGYTKLLCNIKPDGTMIWQKLNVGATGSGTIIQI